METLTIPQIAPQWLNENLYPFKNRYMDLKNGRMHYIDEGDGEILLFIHGTPTWSFLYRNQIKILSKKYRCIAIDHIGFGLSEKPVDFRGTPQDHGQNLEEFINKLGLQNINLVVHDFGGPIGLSFAIQNPDKIKKIILFNTWLWETKTNKDVQNVDKILNNWIGKFLYLKLNFSPKILLKKAFFKKERLTSEIHNQYIQPFKSVKSRWSLLKIGKSLLGSSDWYQNQWLKLSAIESKPWLILWGNKDELLKTEFLDKWKQRLPHAKVLEFESGHFIQEEKGKEASIAISNFLINN